MLINNNVANAANTEYCKFSNPGPLEQEPGRVQGLTVLLYESLYDSLDFWTERRLCDTLNTHMAFLLCVF